MIELKPELEPPKELAANLVPVTFHSSFHLVNERLKKMLARFSNSIDNSVFTDLFLLYLIATKKFLDHRSSRHLFRLVLNIHIMQKKLLHAITFFSQQRHLEIRWIPTSLIYPFASKPVLGCLIGFNVMDRYELFDEENILLTLQKYLPQLRLVKESSYCHTSQYKNLKIFYLEIEKKDAKFFSLEEQKLLKHSLEEKVKTCIQTLSPTIFMGLNEEEIYKNILVLSQEIHTLQDLPQAYITLDQQTGKEIVFRVTLVHITPFHRFSLKESFFECTFVSERVLTVRHLENHPIEAHIFRLHLPRDASFLRSDGSLDFYSARQKVATLIKAAIGDFRDFNGGIILKQHELLHGFKSAFPEIANQDPELIEAFFYALTPVEKQVILPLDALSGLFSYFIECRKVALVPGSSYVLNVQQKEAINLLVIRGNDSSLLETIKNVLQEPSFRALDLAYTVITTEEELFFNCVLQTDEKSKETFIQSLRQSLEHWQQKMKDRQVLKVGLEYSLVSLDPRVGGEVVSGDILRLLFEGLTRFNQNGSIENAVAESISISPNLKEYTFRLRPSFWNDGTLVSAYDFEYAWKKILSPDFKTCFAYLFYPIKNAKDAKEGKVASELVGIHVIDDRTLKVELERPTPYFLQSTAHPLYSPVNRLIDQEHPEWPYQCEKNYPCNGAFQLKMNQPNQGYQLIKNNFYWDANHISFDQITLTLMNPATAIQAFQNNEIDWVGNPFGGWHSFYNPVKSENLISYPNSWACWLVFNTQFGPLKNVKLRQAFAHALNRAKIVEEAFMPLKTAHSPLLPHYRESGPPFYPEFDVEKAKTLFQQGLQEAGISAKDIKPFTLIFNEKGIHKYTALMLKEQFKACFDMDIELKPLAWTVLFSMLTEGNFQMGLIHWTSWVDDPTYTLNAFKYAKQEINFPKWEHPEFQRLLDLGEQEVNPFQRSSHLLKAEEVLCQEVPIVPIFYQPYHAMVRKDLQVLYKIPCGPFNVARSFFKK